MSLLDHPLTMQDFIWLDETQKMEDKFKFFLLDCRQMLIDIRLSLCGDDGLDLPSEAGQKKKSLVGVSRGIRRE